MTSLQRRLRKLEARVAAHGVVEPAWSVAVREGLAVMQERRRRRLEAEGRTFVEPVGEPLVVDDPNDWASVMRACRARRTAERLQSAQLHNSPTPTAAGPGA
jgi:hypothetical protein